MPVPRGSSLDPERTRAVILHTATRIFYERGLDAVGIAELCTSAGVSKETVYRYFGSKNGLIEATLEARSDRVWRWLTKVVEAADDEPVKQLIAVFDAFKRWYSEPGFRGCGIVNAVSQRHDVPAIVIARRHLDRYLTLLTDIATRAGAKDPANLGHQLLILVEGATVTADHFEQPRMADYARQAALTLLVHGSN
ncbi:TetR/AcrR family transcriptional regulator [Streptomyces sp. NPDC059688]|uniref:TetR/AcrR family transcriptional regulator n=1 Tax=Streptomyces sp. NPDC059688 TaxID=3346906 RepID=UPI00367CFF9A